MNPAIEAAVALFQRGVRLRVENEDLRFEPDDRVPPTWRPRLLELKPELLMLAQYLARVVNEPESEFPPGSTVVTFNNDRDNR